MGTEKQKRMYKQSEKHQLKVFEAYKPEQFNYENVKTVLAAYPMISLRALQNAFGFIDFISVTKIIKADPMLQDLMNVRLSDMHNIGVKEWFINEQNKRGVNNMAKVKIIPWDNVLTSAKKHGFMDKELFETLFPEIGSHWGTVITNFRRDKPELDPYMKTARSSKSLPSDPIQMPLQNIEEATALDCITKHEFEIGNANIGQQLRPWMERYNISELDIIEMIILSEKNKEKQCG